MKKILTLAFASIALWACNGTNASTADGEVSDSTGIVINEDGEEVKSDLPCTLDELLYAWYSTFNAPGFETCYPDEYLLTDVDEDGTPEIFVQQTDGDHQSLVLEWKDNTLKTLDMCFDGYQTPGIAKGGFIVVEYDYHDGPEVRHYEYSWLKRKNGETVSSGSNSMIIDNREPEDIDEEEEPEYHLEDNPYCDADTYYKVAPKVEDMTFAYDMKGWKKIPKIDFTFRTRYKAFIQDATGTPTNVRTSPNGEVVAQLHNSNVIQVDSCANGWFHIATNTFADYDDPSKKQKITDKPAKDLWVHKSVIMMQWDSTDGVSFAMFSKPDTDSPIIYQSECINEAIMGVIDIKGQLVKVKLSNDKVGWIYHTLINGY